MLYEVITHAFVSGYDLRTEKSVNDAFAKFDDIVGMENLKILHLNDAKGEIGCNLDRHYHIGLGNIGRKGLSAVINRITSYNVCYTKLLRVIFFSCEC